MSAREKKAKTSDEPVGRFELVISEILRLGVTLSLATILVGLALMFAHHPDYLRSSADLVRLTSPGAALPHSLSDVIEGVRAWRGQAVVALGLTMLILTPILRVAVSIVAFAVERDRVFVAVTSAVLAVLLLSFVLGKVG
ncbi:MAG TPA: DUF1634 domain-containing protein [Syntrophobacteria bacterium]|nr:DUF1634 domain-containing protein [Syntrophobacteria bacterium]